jgi:hypothetical protein
MIVIEQEANSQPHLVLFESYCSLYLCETLAVLDTSNRAFFELHDVLCESACLIAEHVLNLPQLLSQIGGSALRGRVRSREVYMAIDLIKGSWGTA